MEKSPLNYTEITPDYILSLTKPTDHFLCPLSANVYNIQFLSFKIRDFESNQVLFSVEKDPNEEELKIEDTEGNEDDYRTVRYHFGPNFFKLKKVGTHLSFSVGDKPVKNFRMIERHYFQNQLVQNFDFNFPFCMPKTTNSWESIYSVPDLSLELIENMIRHPWWTKSDSFYFVGNELVMHNKAEYNFAESLGENDK